MKVTLSKRVDAGGRVFYAGSVVELSRYPALALRMQELGLLPKVAVVLPKVAGVPVDKMVRSYKAK